MNQSYADREHIILLEFDVRIREDGVEYELLLRELERRERLHGAGDSMKEWYEAAVEVVAELARNVVAIEASVGRALLLALGRDRCLHSGNTSNRCINVLLWVRSA